MQTAADDVSTESSLQSHTAAPGKDAQTERDREGPPAANCAQLLLFEGFHFGRVLGASHGTHFEVVSATNGRDHVAVKRISDKGEPPAIPQCARPCCTSSTS
ncbi:unnamed protein product [Prorocentrum cordatum]|uniref:Protein kinase domain-containing protein n=1 Tax=Prorocentrum cordatum TaxID=2364126 RepID=A0ABN9RTU2_9DINO|nr:unnamed protein product [Polarella glacialis]